MSIKLTDTFETTQANSGGARVTRTLSELNDLISTEESARLDALETSVDTASTGLLDRTTALETSVDTATTGLLDRTSALETEVDTLNNNFPEIGIPDVATQSEAILRDGELDEITLTSVGYGKAENNYTINLIVPETVNETRSLAMAGSVISVTVKTELSGEAVIVSASETATSIAAAISSHGTIGLLFQAAATGTGTTVIADSDSVAPSGGQDATVAVTGKMFIDPDNNLVYLCVADTDGTETVLDNNWQTLELTAISS